MPEIHFNPREIFTIHSDFYFWLETKLNLERQRHVERMTCLRKANVLLWLMYVAES